MPTLSQSIPNGPESVFLFTHQEQLSEQLSVASCRCSPLLLNKLWNMRSMIYVSCYSFHAFQLKIIISWLPPLSFSFILLKPDSGVRNKMKAMAVLNFNLPPEDWVTSFCQALWEFSLCFFFFFLYKQLWWFYKQLWASIYSTEKVSNIIYCLKFMVGSILF